MSFYNSIRPLNYHSKQEFNIFITIKIFAIKIFTIKITIMFLSRQSSPTIWQFYLYFYCESSQMSLRMSSIYLTYEFPQFSSIGSKLMRTNICQEVDIHHFNIHNYSMR